MDEGKTTAGAAREREHAAALVSRLHDCRALAEAADRRHVVGSRFIDDDRLRKRLRRHHLLPPRVITLRVARVPRADDEILGGTIGKAKPRRKVSDLAHREFYDAKKLRNDSDIRAWPRS